MDLREWQRLYARAERSARLFCIEHFADVCARCYEASEAAHDPGLNCCRRTDFVPEILCDPLLGGLAEESLGRTLLPLMAPSQTRRCGALGPTGCRIPFGRPDACHAYLCEHLHRALGSVMDPHAVADLQDALEVFTAIREAPRSSPAAYADCVAQVERLESILSEASRLLRQESARFAAGKEAVMADMMPPVASQ